MTPKSELLRGLEHLPAADLKKRGWRGVMRSMGSKGRIVVTNHGEPEAVIVSAREYERIMEVVNQVEFKAESELEALRHSFDERLAVLQAPDAGDRLRSVMSTQARLGGKVKAGSSY